MPKPLDVLNLEWTSFSSRDRETATLVCNYLRLQGLNVYEATIFDSRRLIEKLHPKIVFISNTVGAPENFNAMKYACSCGAKGVSLISEGNMRPEPEIASQMIWGWNKDRILYEDIHMQWSERSRDITLALHPELRDRVHVSGGVGFDRYKIVPKIPVKSFLEKFDKKGFDQIIGVGCWDFGQFYPEDQRYASVKSQLSPESIICRRQDGIEFNRILHDIIVDNPNILFLLKEHPGVMLGKKASAIEKLENFSNTLILKNEASISDCLAVSDFWLVYESTTALEAWLFGKQTCLLNPSGPDFPRDEMFRGSPHYQNTSELQNALDLFYLKNELPGFSEKEIERKVAIKDVIQWDDGLNHVRAGNRILDLLEKMPEKLNSPKHSFLDRVFTVKERLRYYGLSRNLKNKNMVFSYYHSNLFSQERYKQQMEFYKKLNLDQGDLRNIVMLF